MKVVVGISGGPASLVTAWLLKKQGMQVRGVHFDLFSNPTQRAAIQEIERKLGIPIQMMDVSGSFGDLFLEARRSAISNGLPFDLKWLFQSKVVLPGVEKVRESTGSEKIATGHRVSLLEDPAVGRVRIMMGSGSRLEPVHELLGLGQGQLTRSLAPIGAIPESLLVKLTSEVAPESVTREFGIEWSDLEERLNQADPEPLKREIQVFTLNGVLLGRAALGSLKTGEPFVDSEDPDKNYRLLEVQPQSDRAWVQARAEVTASEYLFDECHWVSGQDLGLGFLEAGMISEEARDPGRIRLIQFEGGKMKGVLPNPIQGEQVKILKGQRVLFMSGSEVLGGARVIKVR